MAGLIRDLLVPLLTCWIASVISIQHSTDKLHDYFKPLATQHSV